MDRVYEEERSVNGWTEVGSVMHVIDTFSRCWHMRVLSVVLLYHLSAHTRVRDAGGIVATGHGPRE